MANAKPKMHPFAHDGKGKLPADKQLEQVVTTKSKQYLGETIMLLPSDTVDLLTLARLQAEFDTLVQDGQA